MSKLSAPIQEVARLLDLVPYLSTHSFVSVKELADEFGVTEKEMVRELTALSMCGLPGYTPYELIEVFFDSGFVTINNHVALDIPRSLTNLEISSLLIGLEILKEESQQNSDVYRAISDLINRLHGIVGDIFQVKDSDFLQDVALINQAIVRRNSLLIQYSSASSVEVSERIVNPLHLYSENGFTYLTAYCYKSSGRRNFRVDRIRSASLVDTPEVKELSDEIKPDSHFSATISISGNRRSISEALSIEQIPPSGRVIYQYFSTQWLLRAATAFMPDLLVEEPDEVRRELRGRISAIRALYRS